jgi:hypothetical protein
MYMNQKKASGGFAIRLGSSLCLAIAGSALLLSLLMLAGSSLISYATVRDHLVLLYGGQLTDRYFTPAIFVSALLRARLAGGFFLVLSIAIAALRNTLSRPIESFRLALLLSVKHERRARLHWNMRTLIALAMIMLTGFLLRLHFIDQPMRYDESVTVLGYASKPFYLGLSIYNEPNNHLFHTLLVHIAMKVAGSAEWAVRLPALAAGMFLCPLVFGLAQRLSGTVAGLWASALVSTSSILVEYSTNARGYTLICCATLALLITGIETLRRASPLWFFLFGFTAILGFWTIPIFLLPFGGTLLWIIWETLDRHRRFRYIYWLRLLVTSLIAAVVTISLYLPPIVVSGTKAMFHNQWIAPHNIHDLLSGNAMAFRQTWELWNRDLPVWWSWILAAAFFGGLATAPRIRRLVICLCVWTLFLLMDRRFVPFARNWLPYLPIFLLVAVAALASLFERAMVSKQRLATGTASAVLLAGLLAVPVLQQRSVLASNETGVFKSALQIEEFTRTRNVSPDQVFRGSRDLPLEYYWWRRTGLMPANASRERLERSGVHQAWFLLNSDFEEQLGPFATQLGVQNFQILERHSFDGATLYRVSW